ncbi:MAG: tRNA (adenosine(37)-N6)-threonylcarbamoyltransferase complex ATPase subunit type 1 TsaE [Nitrospirota bacterium]
MSRAALNEPDTAWRIVSRSEADTHAWGRRLGERLVGGETLALIGELGAGKTRFVQGLAEGLGVDAFRVSSPTFAIRHDHAGRVAFLHLDFYRLHDTAEVEWLGMLDAPDDAVVAIEWADRLPGALPDDCLEIALTSGPAPDDRSLTFTARGPRAERALAALRAAHDG